MRNLGYAETTLVEAATYALRQALPSTWSVTLELGHVGQDPHADQAHTGTLLTVTTPNPDVPPTVFVVQVLTGGWSRAGVRNVVRHALSREPARPVLLVTEFANPALRDACQNAAVSYVDTTGWIHLRHDQVGLYVVREGAAKPPAPDRTVNAIARLDGPGAGALIRALWEAPLPIGVRALAEAAHVSAGTSAKVLPTLAQYGAIERGHRGQVTAVDRHLLLQRWTEDYHVYESNPEVRWFLAPRGPDMVYADLHHLLARDLDTPVAQTGYLAVLTALPDGTYPVIPHALISLYSPHPDQLATALHLRSVPRASANAVIIRPRDPALIAPYQSTVPLPQALADLLTMGGRFPELAEQVLEHQQHT